MKDAHELLAKLRAAGVEPVTDAELLKSLKWQMTTGTAFGRRVALSVLEARALLAEVREWAEGKSDDGPLPSEGAEGELAERICGAQVLTILDKEPTP